MKICTSSSELKVGDWIRNEDIFGSSDGKYIWSSYTLAKVKDIKKDKDDKLTIKISCWFVEVKKEIKISKGGEIDPNKTYYILEEKDISDEIKKKLILEKL